MDLIEILRHRIESLAAGEYIIGLRAVLQHIVVAANHLARGQSSGDDTAFTDAIYRTNQAFEGSLKEAYRVLADRDPAAIRPFDIENFLQTQNVLRSRVLAQFSTYRKAWRNPSTHDYRLDFDEDEALLAIVSVSAFAIVLIDQISERISFTDAQAKVQMSTPIKVAVPLADQIAEVLHTFQWQRPPSDTNEPPRQSDLIGAIAGFLSATLAGAHVQTDIQMGTEQSDRVDLMVSHGNERAIVEIKRGLWDRLRSFFVGGPTSLAQLKRYMELTSVNQGVLYRYRANAEFTCQVITDETTRIVIVSPVEPPPSAAPSTEQVVSQQPKEDQQDL
jgi:hypothetical protein